MKKLFLVGALALFAAVNAQETKFGAKAGVNVSTLSGEGEKKSKIGFHVGGLAEIKFNDKMALQPELLFSTGGGEYSYNDVLFGDRYYYTQKFDLASLEMPIMFKYYVTEGLNLQAGPQLGYLVTDKSNVFINVPTASYTMTSDFNLSDKTVTYRDNGGYSDTLVNDFKEKKFKVGFNIGAEYALPMGLFFQARYNLGLTDFSQNANLLAGRDTVTNTQFDARYQNKAYKNSNIQFSIGYTFGK